jgi:D-serine deaminase-like pyridoxal phosphate-dependent protein
VDAGKRDLPVDVALPAPLRVWRKGVVEQAPAGWALEETNDQHGYLSLGPEDPLLPGDLVSFGITHPCTFFDKWTWIPVVDEEGRAVDVVRTFF